MLAIATTVVLPGTDPVNVCPVLCSRGNAAVTSFAKSFAESSVLVGEAQALGPDGKLLKDADGGVSVGSTKDVGVTAGSIDLEAKVDASAGAAVKNKGVDAKNLISVIDAKVVIPGPKGGKEESPEHVALLEDAKSDRDVSAAIQTEASEGQLSSDGVKDIAQELSSGMIDGGKTGGTGGASNPRPDSTASAMPCIPGNGEKLPIPNRKEVRIVEDKEEEIQAKKVPKDHDVVVKTGKAVKIEKPDKTGRSAANPVEIVAQAGMTVPVVVLPVGEQPTRTSAVPDEDDVSFLASATIGPSLGANTVIGGNAAKHQAITAKPDVSETKADGSSSIDDPALEKIGDDGGKTSTPAAPATVEGNSKPLNAIAAVPAIALKHADGVIAGMLSPTGPGAPIAPHVTGRTQVAVGSHAVTTQSGAGMQTGAGASDATMSIDTAHRTLTATPTSLEVGVANGSHGWLKIRAEMGDGGVVNASLATASPAGQESLHRDLPSLTAYLQSEHVALNTVVVQPAAPVATDPRGIFGGLNGDGRGQAQQGGGQRGDNRQDTPNTAMDRMEKSVPYNNLSGVRSDDLLPSMPYARGGNWLSVRA